MKQSFLPLTVNNPATNYIRGTEGGGERRLLRVLVCPGSLYTIKLISTTIATVRCEQLVLKRALKREIFALSKAKSLSYYCQSLKDTDGEIEFSVSVQNKCNQPLVDSRVRGFLDNSILQRSVIKPLLVF